jgi:hypothetical protein
VSFPFGFVGNADMNRDYGCNGKRLCGINESGVANLISVNFNDIMSAYRCN